MDFDAQKLVDVKVVGLPSSAPVLDTPKTSDPLQKAASSADADARGEQAKSDIADIKKIYQEPGQDLAMWVKRRFDEASSNRSSAGIDTAISDALRMRKGEYTEAEKALLGGEQTAVWFPLVERQCLTAVSFLKNVLNKDQNRMFELMPTPVPDLPTAMKDAASDYLVEQLQEAVQLGVAVDAEAITLAAENMRQTLVRELEQQSQEAARTHTKLIDDQLTEAGWGTVFEALLDDFVTYPAAVIAGPETTISYEAKWKNGKLSRVRKREHRYRNVDPLRCYPSPDSTTPNDGQYFIELREFSARALQDSKSLPGWLPKHVDVMLNEHPNGYTEFGSSTNTHSVERLKDSPHRSDTNHLYDVICMFGLIPGKYLMEMGITKDRDGNDINSADAYESEVFVMGDLPVRAVLVKREHEVRPYYSASMYRKVGSFWGGAIPSALKDLQRLG